MLNRIWLLPNGVEVHEEVDKPDDYGVSFFWFCVYCRDVFAEARLSGRIYSAVGGCCPSCKGHRWAIPGGVEALHFVGQTLPIEVLQWQLQCEVKFLDHPDHPMNKDTQ